MKRNRRQKICLIAAVLWMAVIFMFSMRNGEESQEDSNRVGYIIGEVVIDEFEELPEAEKMAFAESISYPVRKGAHMSEYAALTLFLFGSLYPAGKALTFKKAAKSAGCSFCLAVLYAATDEFHQYFIGGRSGQVTDVCIDGSGALLMAGLLLLFAFFLQRRQRNAVRQAAG